VNGKERILCALRRNVPDTVPVFEWFVDASVARALTGSEDILDVVEHLDLDAVNVRPDYAKRHLDETTIVDEWQIARKLTGDVLPALAASPIRDVTQHRSFALPDPAAPHRFETLEKAIRRCGDTRAVVLNLRDGFSDMRDLLGYEAALMAMLLEPEAFGELLDRVVDFNLEMARVARQRYGVEIVATTDDVANATGLLMRPATWFKSLAPNFRRIMQGYRDLGYLTIKHCDGNIDAVVDYWIDSGIDCLDPIDPSGGYTIGQMKARYGNRICLKGNVDCTTTLCDATPEQVAEEVRQCIEQGRAGGGLIISSSNTIHRGVKPENFRAMVEATRRYGVYES
jgi:uroporphyrinogen decarboxylase